MKHSFGHRRLAGKKRRRRRRAQQLRTWLNTVPNQKFFGSNLALGARCRGLSVFGVVCLSRCSFTLEASMTLMLHAGATALDYDGLRQLETPAATATHVPIPHFRVVDLLKTSSVCSVTR